MSEMNDKKKKPRCDQKQLELLLECSGNNNISEWNQWRKENKNKDILLEGAPLGGHDLKGVHLNSGVLKDNDKHCFQGKVYLKGANFYSADLEEAFLTEAYLEGAQLKLAHLKDADLSFAHLQGTDLTSANLESASLRWAIVDGSTLMKDCEVDSNTDFRGVGLGYVRIDEEIKLLLQYNMRRINWKEWYKNHCLWRWPISIFWYVSDYGRNTPRIVKVFFYLAFIFAVVYANSPGTVSGLNVEPHEPLWHYFLLLIVRPVYFSIVTMTTLGFGDMYANIQSIWGHVLLTVQVLCGYVLLGAIVSRFAILFTAGGVEIEFRESGKKKFTRKTEG